ncbi:hypothetical protein SCHPADRAFT_849198 [Schizopora paradoxa]|uniref:Zn(2)-C6 fungal-type domain-containing protein n=1 Tax=Schizopora paradoxa TaxID=27342 RepID=A0A0H2RUZ4_9AGAM|nr:hypothetical protein SCHPADRAFT_849198 [Schizopora paradoxa]
MTDNVSSSSTVSMQQMKKRAEDPSMSTDSGLKPMSLQRRRVWRACESCRKKKIKCDGNEPLCTQCANAGTQCTWVQTKDRAALSRQYVQELEARLLHMEDVFKQIAPVVEALGNTPNGASVQAIVSSLQGNGTLQSNASPPTQSKPLTVKRERKSSELSTSPSPRSSKSGDDDVSEAFGQLALDEHGHFRWIGGSSTMSLIQTFRSLTTSPLHRVSPMEEDPLSPHPSANKLYFSGSVNFGKTSSIALPHAEEVNFPPRELADKLVAAYFSRLHSLLPVVDKLKFLREYNYLMDHMDDVAMVRENAPYVALVFSVFACASRIVEDPGLSGADDSGMEFYERALILHYISHASIQIAHVQCFIILSSFLCSVNCLPQAWLLVGQAVRMAQDLGLHRITRQLNASPIDKQVRKKVFWCVYTLDRMLALTLGRPIGILDSDCDAEFPDPYDDEQLPDYYSGAEMQKTEPSLMEGFIALCELYRIAGRVCHQIYGIDKCRENLEPEKVKELVASAEELDRELVQWAADLPNTFKSAVTNETFLTMGAVLCSHYYAILITLHRNFLPITPNYTQGPPSLPQKAINSVKSYINLAPSVKNVVPPSHNLAFFIQQLFTAAVIEMLLAMYVSGKEAQAAIQLAESCIGFVASWEGVWPGARKCKELLSDCATTAREAMNKVPAQHPGRSEDRPSANSPSARSSSATPVTHISRSESRSTRGKSSRAKSRESRASLNRTTSPYRRRNASSARRALEDFDRKDSGSGSPTSPTFHSAFPPSYQSMTEQKPILVDNQSTGSNETGKRQSVSFLAEPVFGPSMPPPSTSSSAGPALGYSYSHQDQQHPWGPDPMSAGIFTPQETDYSSMFGSGNPNHNGQDFTSYASASPFGAMINLPGQGESPPSSSFGTQGLPFPALDFIRNLNGNGYDESQESFWQVFDNGDYRFDQDMTFPLGELPTDGTDQHDHMGT